MQKNVITYDSIYTSPNGPDGPPNGPDGLPNGPPNGPDGGAGDRRVNKPTKG